MKKMTVPVKIPRIAAAAAAVLSLAALVVLPLGSVANAASAPGAINPAIYAYPTHYTTDGTPEYGTYGSGNWQVAGLVNIGEPTLRVVYDASVPGAYQQAMATVYEFQAQAPSLPQPGVTTGLREVGYTAHYNGVQIQVYSNLPSVSVTASTAFAQAGIPLIPMGA
jgi:hypothetical protein